uniref:non-specific serine/threonine protein kinase n=1 Tax=Euborellia annulipes TaxID=146833 RepID=A0A8S4C1B0_9NEOP|nr:Warts [Euborellia annulipes]CAG6407546.1 Serine/threonine-protein kinase Warts [Euborellia annulipes]
MGYSEDVALRALKVASGRYESALDYLKQNEPINGLTKGMLNTKLNRKPSIERELSLHRGSPALDSGAGSSRSDSPRLADLGPHTQLSRQYSPSNFTEPPPPPPPRCSSTPPPPTPPHSSYPTVPTNMQQLLKRISPSPIVPSRPPPALPTTGVGVSVVPPPPQRGTSPVALANSATTGRQPMIVQNGPQVQQQLTQQMQALNLYSNSNSSTSTSSEPPPPYPLVPTSPVVPPPPPSYNVSVQSRQSPTQPQDFRKSPSSGIYSGPTSAGSPSPITVSVASPTPNSVARPTPLQAWGARQTKTQPPIIMQSVKSTQVQKPILQTAIAPKAPQPLPPPATTNSQSVQPPPPSYASSIQQKQQLNTTNYPPKPAAPQPQPPSVSPVTTASPVTVPTTDPPSYASTMQALAAQRGIVTPAVHLHYPIPPPPYSPGTDDVSQGQIATGVSTVESSVSPRPSPAVHPPLQRKYSPVVNVEPTISRSESPVSTSSTESRTLTQTFGNFPQETSSQPTPPLPPTASSSVINKNKNNNVTSHNGSDRRISHATPSPTPSSYKINHQSPIPERKVMSIEKEEERDCKVKNYSPQAFKFFMEQHVENIIKSHKQRVFRRVQLEAEMTKARLSPEAQSQMRKMLYQKESNYIRLKRAKMDKTMFTKIKPIGVGAFGEVTLVRKIDTNHLYAMKTLRKADVLNRNQMAHVKAERDILAEADNEWVVKLYYSFQDKDNLYFVMDYIPGGDLMALLIKKGVFEEPSARFYIAELTCALESVHKMGFIHRDIKPDNILIDRDGHIKLTDFGLCTGFRWTHNSKYYQNNGEHGRQDSMDPTDEWNTGSECRCHQLKPLERRRRREHQRCLAHSLVGTPNYIAPEVLSRTGYTQLCDWWSVGVILYEMLVGSPPFLANTPAETQYKVIHWESSLMIPSTANLSPEGRDLILKLCTGADRRLGKNASEVKAHPFFRNVDFENGVRQQQPPHKPYIKYSTDTSNFDPVDPERKRNSGSSGSDERGDDSRGFHEFSEFNFRRFFDDGGAPPTFFFCQL